MKYIYTPWAVKGEDIKVVDKNGNTVALVADENINHAMLIAAAPLMLEALKEIVEEGLKLRGALALVIIAQAAIDAVEGKEGEK